MDSPDRAVEQIKEEDELALVENPDLHLIQNKDDQSKAFVLHSEALNDKGQQSPPTNSNSADLSSPQKNYEESYLPIKSDPNYDDMGRTVSVYADQEQRSSFDENQSDNKNERTEGDNYIAHLGDFLDNNVNKNFNNEFQTKDSYSLPHSAILTGDDDTSYEMIVDEALTDQSAKATTLDKTENGVEENASRKFHFENNEVNVGKDGVNMSAGTETNKDDFSSVIATSENGGMVWECSSLHSPPKTQNASPSPERQFSLSAERSHAPHTSSSPKQEGLPSPTNIEKKAAYSPISSGRKHSRSPEKRQGGHKRPPSHDRSSPRRQKSRPEKITHAVHRESRRRDGSPRKHIAPSPRRQDSPRSRGRLPRSPVRRRDSPVLRRDQQRRSRSRSPHARDRYQRSPRRRQSPRRRSPPPSYSRRRSPRRPWSPPANRNTGLGKPGNNLFVAGFGYIITERDLEKKFARFGKVLDVRVVRDRRSGESRGFGFLSLERDEDADAAIRAVDQTEWNGRILLVEKSKTSTRS